MIQIVVYQDEQTQEDGTVLRPHVAALVHKDIATQGTTPRHALRLLRDWVLATQDMDDLRVSTIDAVQVAAPKDPEDEIVLVRTLLPDEDMPAGSYVFVERATVSDFLGQRKGENGANLGPAAELVGTETLDAVSDPRPWERALAALHPATRKRLVEPEPVPVYPPARAEVVAKFAAGQPLAFDDLQVPADWQVRAGV